MTKKLKYLLIKLLLSVTLLLFIISPITFKSKWELIQTKASLKYGTRTSLLSYFEVGDDKVGYEFQLLKEFCNQNNLQLETKVYQNNGALLADLKSGLIDIAGGHLSVTKERAKSFAFTTPINKTAINLVTHFHHRDSEDISEFESLKGQLVGSSSYQELLNELTDFNPQYITTDSNDSLFELFRKINQKEIDYTFADSEIINIYQNFIPGIYQPLQISPEQDIAFLVYKNRSDELVSHLNAFIESAQNSGQLSQFKNEILTYLPKIDIADTVTFFDKLQTNWPSVKQKIMEVAAELEFDPALLAAISYQESHWNPEAISFSGVKGLMMLTQSTAEEMNVSDRTNAKQSLIGGVKYFRKMHAKIPDRIQEPDRTLFALTAYNIGFGHLEDARILAQKAGADPDQWLAVEPYLKQLNNPAIAHELNFGIADGKTAAIYVNNIMTYKQLMIWKIQKDEVAKTNPPIM